jgi:1-deoxy-D-xylulose-5-phosphate synthase
MVDHGYTSKVKRLGIPDRYVEHGTQPELWAECGYDEHSIYKTAKEMVGVTHAL